MSKKELVLVLVTIIVSTVVTMLVIFEFLPWVRSGNVLE